MAEMGKLYQFHPPRISSGDDSLTAIAAPTLDEHAVRIDTNSDISPDTLIQTKELYPLPSNILLTAFNLLEEGLSIIDEAIVQESCNDIAASDDAVMRLQVILPELFCCRSLSDGFGATVLAIYYSLHNMEGNPLNSSQLKAIKAVIKRLKTEPYLAIDEAVDEIMNLDNVGFKTESPHLDDISGLLND
jgi:hypothetical protein